MDTPEASVLAPAGAASSIQSGTPPTPKARRWAWRIGLLAVLAALISAAIYWHLTAPDRWFKQGLAALESRDQATLERTVRLLALRGRFDEASFLRGKAHVLEGRRLLEEAFVHARQEQVEQTLFFLLGLGARQCQPVAQRVDVLGRVANPSAAWSAWLASGSQRADLQERTRAAFQLGLDELNHVVSEGPLRTEAAFLRGDCFVRLGDLRRAASMLRYVLDQNPDDIEAHRLLASLYYDTGAMSRAIFHLEEVARLDEKDGRPLRMLGAIHKDFRNATRAVNAYRTALDRPLTPAARAEVLRELSEVLINELGQHREALDFLRSVPPEFAHQPDILVLQAECLWQLQADKSEAQKLVDEAIRIDPELGPALVMQGKLLLHYEKPHESLEVLEHARRLDPFDHKCRNQLVAAYTLLAREADDEVQQTLALQGLADSLVPLGTAPSLPATLTVAAAETRRQTYLFFREDHMKASQIIVDTLLKLSELSAKAEAEVWNAEVRFAIGSIWIQLHRPGMARMWLNAALVCDPQHRGARDALAFLDRQEQLRP